MEDKEFLANAVHDFVHWAVMDQENCHRPINVSDVLEAMQSYIAKMENSNVEFH